MSSNRSSAEHATAARWPPASILSSRAMWSSARPRWSSAAMSSARCAATTRQPSSPTRHRCSRCCSTVSRRAHLPDHRIPPAVDCARRRIEAATVVDDPRGPSPLLVDGQLRFEPLQRGSLVEAVALAEPPDLHIGRRVDEQDSFEHGLTLVLEEQRHVDGDQRRRAREGDCDMLLSQLEDPRMRDLLEVAACRRIREHDLAQACAVERAVGLDHIPAKPCRNLVQGGLAGAHRLTGKLVGVDHDSPTLLEHPVDGALAGCDSPGKADQSHGRGPYSCSATDSSDQPGTEVAHEAPDAHDASPSTYSSMPWSSATSVHPGVAAS